LRSDASGDAGALLRRVQLAEHDVRAGDVSGLRAAREDELVVVRSAEFAPPLSELDDDVGGDVPARRSPTGFLLAYQRCA
jgi:hypothetical protein